MSGMLGNHNPGFGRFQSAAATAEPKAALVPTTRGITKMVIAICAGRVSYREVGCDLGQPRNRGTFADFLPVRFSDLGQCVHSPLRTVDGKRLRQQKPCTVNRTNSARPKMPGKFVRQFVDLLQFRNSFRVI
jgi:hypothetical protein